MSRKDVQKQDEDGHNDAGYCYCFCGSVSTTSSSTSSHCSTDLSLIPGLPNELALLCLARVPSLVTLWTVCRAWRRMLSTSALFQRLRFTLAMPPQLWLYALLRNPADGLFSWHAFDPLCSAWHALPAFPSVDLQLSTPSFIGLMHPVQCASSATKLFMLAASRSTSAPGHPTSARHVSARQHLAPALDRPLVFDAPSKRWTRGAPFRVPRRWCASGVASGKVYVAGGCAAHWDVRLSKEVDVYDPERDTWLVARPLRSSKFSGEAITAVNHKGRLHMVSGKGVLWKVGVIYDPGSDTWADMPRGMRNGWTGCCVEVDGRLVAVDESVGRLKAYHEADDRWVTVIENHAMLKRLEQAVAAAGKICGIVRAARDAGQQPQADVLRVTHTRGQVITFTELHPPIANAQVVSIQASWLLHSDLASADWCTSSSPCLRRPSILSERIQDSRTSTEKASHTYVLIRELLSPDS